MKKQLKRTLFSIFLLIYATFTTLTGVIGASQGVASTLGDPDPKPELDPYPFGDLGDIN